MARISIIPAASSTVLSLRRRSFAVVAAEVRRAPATGGAMEGRATAAAEKVYWMRDPKTGNWMPEDRFGDVDVAELRRGFSAAGRGAEQATEPSAVAGGGGGGGARSA